MDIFYMLSFPRYTNYLIWQNDTSTRITSQLSVLLTYNEGREMVAPKLLNIQFERPRTKFYGPNEPKHGPIKALNLYTAPKGDQRWTKPLERKKKKGWILGCRPQP